MDKIPKILIIAGSDPSGGAGIQTDIKVATRLNVYAAAAITALTSQNTKNVTGIYNPDSKILDLQLQTVLQDIEFDAIKVGMVAGSDNIKVIIKNILKYCKDTPVIIDPVMVSTSNDSLFDDSDIGDLKKLISLSKIVTPNIDEAEKLSSFQITSRQDMIVAATKIKKLGVENVLIKAGHLDQGDVVENVLLDKDSSIDIIANNRLDRGGIHGTGCALATAIACFIAYGYDISDSVIKANEYIFENINKSHKVGSGSAILTHFK